MNIISDKQTVVVPADQTGMQVLMQQYLAIRQASEDLCAPLEIEDYGVQTMVDVSPPKWHLAHTSWFFETFLLASLLPGYRHYHPDFVRLFNSYYEQVGEYHPRPKRGLLSRPTVKEVYAYRAYVDQAMLALLDQETSPLSAQIEHLTRIGLNHEQQHQELLLTDIKHILGSNPLRPAYRQLKRPTGQAAALHWQEVEAGLVNIGATGDGFHYDNEVPRHKAWLEPFRLASRPVTNREYLDFINDQGYQRPEFWLSEGWSALKQNRFSQPLYWEQRDGHWHEMTLGGLRPLDLEAPVCHVNYFEADAYATWAGHRLPTEMEWEHAASAQTVTGNLRDSDWLQPIATQSTTEIQQMFGDVWEWTQSAYSPYPGFTPPAGALGEYNGKFMCGQYVLRGGSCVTPGDHIRASYRNFFYPADQWQFSGIRLAGDV
jgi:ergothioneine biosynthesis protein EgtB